MGVDVISSPPVVAAVLTILFSVFAGPWLIQRAQRRSQAIAFEAHLADVVRDFRESVAVAESIVVQRRAAFPSNKHLDKLGVPPSLLTSNLVTIGNLQAADRPFSFKLENWLNNLNADVAAMKHHKDMSRREALDAELRDFAEKLRNLSKSIARHKSGIAGRIETSPDAKQIVYDDGRIVPGIAWQDDKPAYPSTDAPFT